MSKDERTQMQYLMDIIEKINRIKKKISNISYREFVENEDLTDIIFLNVMIIGEAVSQLDSELLFKINSDKRYWRRIKDTRNYLIHEYHGVDFKILYDVATKRMDELEENIEKILILISEKKEKSID